MGNSPSKNGSINTPVLSGNNSAASGVGVTLTSPNEDDEPGISGSSGYNSKRISKEINSPSIKFLNQHKPNVAVSGSGSKLTHLHPPGLSTLSSVKPASPRMSTLAVSASSNSLDISASSALAMGSKKSPPSGRTGATGATGNAGGKTHRRLESLSLPPSATETGIEETSTDESNLLSIETNVSTMSISTSVSSNGSISTIKSNRESKHRKLSTTSISSTPSTLLRLKENENTGQQQQQQRQPQTTETSPTLSSSISSISSNSNESSSSTSTASTSPPSPSIEEKPSTGTSSKHSSTPSSSTLKNGPPSNPVNSYIKRLLAAGMNHRRLNRTFCLTHDEIKHICTLASEIFLSQPILLELGTPVKIVGDIHGQYTDLLRIFRLSGMPPKSNYLFLGDYVDRGKQSLETMLLLLCLKIKHPENVFLLRGNHECASVTKVYGFYDECKRRCSIKIWKSIVDVFNTLPIAATVGGKIFCIHGGLSPHLHSMNDILNISRPTDVPDEGLLSDLLWSDPDPDIYQWSDNDRGVSYCFSKSVLDKFCRKFGFDLVARGHMVVEDGYEFFGHRKLVTVFSAPNYCGEFGNWGAILSVSKDLLCSFELLKPLDSSGQALDGTTSTASSSTTTTTISEKQH